MKQNKWAEELYDWVESRVKFAIEHRSQIFQILGTLAVFIIAAGSLQYVPFLIGWFHISDLAFGRAMVYSLPFWVAFAIYLIWRS